MVNDLSNIWQKFYLTLNDPLPVLPDIEQDLSHDNTVNTQLFCQVCKVHDIVCFGDSVFHWREVMTP